MNEAAGRGDVVAAERIFRSISAGTARDRKTMVYNTVLKACANGGNIAKSEEWYTRMEVDNVRVNAKSFGKMIEAAAKTGDVTKASKWHSEMLEKLGKQTQDEISLSTLMDGCAKAGRIQEAENWFYIMKAASITPILGSYTCMTDACAKAGKPEQAAEWFHKIRRASLVPDLIAYNSVADAFAQAVKPKEAVTWFQQAEAAGLTHNLVSYSTIIHAYANKGNVKEAFRWFRKAENVKLKPDVVAYSSVVAACANACQFDDAEKLIHQMEGSHVELNAIAYTSIITACSRMKPPLKVRAESMFRQMIRNKVEPDAFLINTLSRILGEIATKRLLSELRVTVKGKRAKHEINMGTRATYYAEHRAVIKGTSKRRSKSPQ